MQVLLGFEKQGDQEALYPGLDEAWTKWCPRQSDAKQASLVSTSTPS